MLSCAALCAAEEVQIAAAADLRYVLPELVRGFEQAGNDTARVSFGASGNFAAQIENGAPYELFLSADEQYPARLERENLIEPGGPFPYATGKLVVWVRKDSPVDVAAGMRVLAESRVQKIAVANPEQAPYGRAAIAALRAERLYERVRGKLVFGESILQTATWAESGDADAGLIALSLAVAPRMRSEGTYYLVPSGDYPKIVQTGCILRRSTNKDAARRFVEYLQIGRAHV